MRLEQAALALVAALKARAASWVPCETTPGELAREYGGPPPTLTGRVMREPWLRDIVLANVERAGWTIRYDQQRRAFLLGPSSRRGR